MRDVFDINFGGSHAGRLKSELQSSKFKVKRHRSLAHAGKLSHAVWSRRDEKTKDSLLVELALDQSFEFGDRLGGIRSVGVNEQFAAGAGREHHQAHDAFAVDL